MKQNAGEILVYHDVSVDAYAVELKPSEAFLSAVEKVSLTDRATYHNGKALRYRKKIKSVVASIIANRNESFYSIFDSEGKRVAYFDTFPSAQMNVQKLEEIMKAILNSATEVDKKLKITVYFETSEGI